MKLKFADILEILSFIAIYIFIFILSDRQDSLSKRVDRLTSAPVDTVYRYVIKTDTTYVYIIER